jgi:P27 family predicted phage terminase small subunit
MAKPRIRQRRPPPAPTHLSREAAEVWRRAVARLAAHGRLEGADENVLAGYCMAVTRQRALQAELDRVGVLDDGKLSPMLRVIEATAATVKNLSHVLGLNPPFARRTLPGKFPPATKGGRDVWRGVLK